MVLRVDWTHVDDSPWGFSCDWSQIVAGAGALLKASSSTCLVVDAGWDLSWAVGWNAYM